VLDQYNFLFNELDDTFGLGCDRTRPQCLSEADKADIISCMQLLAFDGRGVTSKPGLDIGR
jgi:hypothetical protein